MTKSSPDKDAKRGEDISDRGTYEVGYRKPPKHGQFTKGRSANPRGRPKKLKGPERLASHFGLDEFDRMVLEEARRTVRARDGDRTVELTAMQALVRSTLMLAAKGDRHARDCVTDIVRDAQRTQAKKKQEAYDSWLKHYEKFKPIFDEHEAKDLPPPEIYPNPYDLIFNPNVMEVRLDGPGTADEHEFLMIIRKKAIGHKLRAERAARDYSRARSPSKKEHILDSWHRAQAHFDEHNDLLPGRYKLELEHRSEEPGASQPKDDRDLLKFILKRRPR
jgi:hypothetical protein